MRITITVLTILAMLVSLPNAIAHDIYENLYSPSGQSCCHDRDCQTVTLYRTVKGGAEFFVKNTWIFVEESKIQYKTLEGDLSKSGAHWCGVVNTLTNYKITYCAILPPGSM